MRTDHNDSHTIEDLTNDVLKILDHLNIKRVRALVGLSIDVVAGLIFGAKYPDRVDRVIVVGTRATSNPESNANHTTCIQFDYENGPDALGRQSIARWFDEEWTAANPEGIAHAEKIYCKQNIQVYEASIAALQRLNLFTYAEDVGRRRDGARFVLVAGELDGTVPQESRELAAKMGSQTVIIPKSGHITPLQMPEIFHNAVQQILKF
jgi:3-oxoadipate enol-lactonase